MDLQLDGKRAIVTGGSRGIGKAVAKSLIAEGARVVIVARTAGPLRSTAMEIGAEAVVGDTGLDESVRTAVAQAVELLGGIDILINSAAQPAGQSTPPKLVDVTDEAFYGDVNVKVMGYLRCIREVVPHLITAGGGRIVNVSGVGARQTGSVIGSMRNVAVAAMTKNAADELGSAGIGVTLVHPGMVRTEATPGVLAARAAATGLTLDEVDRQMGSVYDIGRMVTADEVATVVTFLASPRAVGITGDPVVCSGGVRGAIHY